MPSGIDSTLVDWGLLFVRAYEHQRAETPLAERPYLRNSLYLVVYENPLKDEVLI